MNAKTVAPVWSKEKGVGEHLPYAAQIDPRTLRLRDGRLMQVIELEGIAFETLDSEELDYRKALRDAMLQSLGTSRFALYQHVVRRRVEPVLDGEFPDEFTAQLDRRWRERLNRKALFSNQLFLCVILRPLQGKGGKVSGIGRLFRSTSAVEREALLSEDRDRLAAAVDALEASLGHYGARVLESYEHNGVLFSEQLEFLSMLLDGPARPVALPESDVGHYLPRRRVSFGAHSVELSSDGTLPRRFAALIAIKEYPAQTSSGFLDDVMRLPFELQISQSFAIVDRQAAVGRINLALRRMRAADDEALSLRDELAEARDAVAAGRTIFGEHHLTITVFGESEDELASNTSEVQATLADLGVVSTREDLALEPSFWAQMPGNFKYIARRALISSRNFASLASLHNFPTGTASENHWGPAVSVLETSSAGPYHFNFHHGDLGNFTVIGPSGSGKTVVLNFLLAQARKFDPRIVFFDKDRGAELFLRATGGRYDELRTGLPSGLNPLAMEDTPENRRFLADWIGQLVTEPGVPLTAEDRARIREGVDANMEAPMRFRRLAHFAQLLKGGARPHPGDLAARLAPWWGEGERAWLFDNEHDLVDLDQKVVGFDMTRLLDDPVVRTPAMMYLFHRIEQRLDGTPTIIVVDEGWKALDDEAFTSRIRDWEKTIRKRNGIVGFATQSAEDALDSKIASAIVEQAATQIFMANPKAPAAAYKDGFGLTEHEYEIIRSLPDTARAFLVKHGQHSVVVRLDLSGEPDLITILSGRETTIRMLDEMRGDGGDLPSDWLPRILERAAA
ncbi:VirB4 family type IV secretion/conjugal transfer ATPase [Qipengyuania sp. 6B39]|uniref:VirB4 family type IV secretion/conjugal transfer ATPase n=1 Tax=Qipengyuania proteolytica TaxID=2867239 RepID=UPI001C8999D3|nr:VirB4 family type IV secretion/conjugal transfer ATPase [Qipengyuania proteolytica]MBX7494874.1 VirB4 family type IV secretion/conjugal transfer ATPase [Qipengyuania proteolytica]